MSSLGAAVETAVPVTQHSNLRSAFNIFVYGQPFETDGITYKGELNFRSVQANYDWFPLRGGFRLSPGILVYNGNQV